MDGVWSDPVHLMLLEVGMSQCAVSLVEFVDFLLEQ